MKNKLQSPLLIGAIILLLINDFYLKQTFGNVITGKLSDFAGLFAFPFFFSCLFPQYKKRIHIATALIFVWWKSHYSGFFIENVNLWGIPIGRTVDFSDNIALLSIVASYFAFRLNVKYKTIKPVLNTAIIGIALFSFTATSIPPKTVQTYTNIGKVYVFDKPIDIFITEFNELQKKEIEQLDKYKIAYEYNVDEGTYIYTATGDTLTHLIRLGKDRKDTVYVNSYFANYKIYEVDDNRTALSLVNMLKVSDNTGLLGKIFPGTEEVAKVGRFKKKNAFLDNTQSTPINDIAPINEIHYRVTQDSLADKKLIKEFEKRVVKKLK